MNYFKPTEQIIEDFKKLSHSDRAKELHKVGNNYQIIAKSDIAMIGEETAQTKYLAKLYNKMNEANLEALNTL